jgi:hypothetical protein
MKGRKTFLPNLLPVDYFYRIKENCIYFKPQD